MAGRWLGLSFGLLGSLLAATALAQQPALKGDPQRGAALASTCLGCHGIEGYRNAYPDYAVPRLAGQHADYLAAALGEYKSDARQYPTMHLQALSLSDQDIVDVASYLASKPLVATSSAAPAQIPQPAVVCASCHGRDGIGVTPAYPSLAGQHASYIERAIAEYQTGYRKNPIMNGMAASLKPADIRVIAQYFSSLKPGLHTESRPFFTWTDHSKGAK
ncbi:MAG TPA: c-type cytochrome [Steroidobacteraceae bacterium]|nr:c-type cytochrome [Steroidobacteraceae bacterium]